MVQEQQIKILKGAFIEKGGTFLRKSTNANGNLLSNNEINSKQNGTFG